MKKLLTIIVIILSTWLALQIGLAIPLLGNSIAAIIIGVVIRHTPIYDLLDKSITGFVGAYLLKTGIVLLGFTLSLRIIGEVGLAVLLLLALGVVISIEMAVLLGKLFKLDNKLALLVGIGTSICGGSAIIAVAPILKVKEKDMAVSITTMLIYSMVALILLPSIGHLLGYSDQMYGIFAGAAVNDTASVVATSFNWSDAAGSFATVTKLTRTLYLVPVTLGVILTKFNQERVESKAAGHKLEITFEQIIKLIPVFVILFIVAVVIATMVNIPSGILDMISSTSKILMTMSLVTIGLGVHIKDIMAAGLRPVLLGGLCWAGVVVNSVFFINLFYR